MGPPENPRTLNLIQWAMQLGSLAAIVMSSYHQVPPTLSSLPHLRRQAASLLLALLLVSWASVPSSVKAVARTAIIKTFFRPEVLTTISLQTSHSPPPPAQAAE